MSASSNETISYFLAGAALGVAFSMVPLYRYVTDPDTNHMVVFGGTFVVLLLGYLSYHFYQEAYPGGSCGVLLFEQCTQ